MNSSVVNFPRGVAWSLSLTLRGGRAVGVEVAISREGHCSHSPHRDSTGQSYCPALHSNILCISHNYSCATVDLTLSHTHRSPVTGHQSLAITSFHVEEKIFHCPVALGCGACIVAGIQEQKMASHWHQFYAPCLEPHSPTLVWK